MVREACKIRFTGAALCLLAVSMLTAAPAVAAERGITVAGPEAISPGAWGTYHALIIGINDYRQWPRLQTAVKDATALSQLLVDRYGFDKNRLTLLTDKDATRRQIIADLRRIAAAMAPTDNLLIYYAGHGQLDDFTGDGYWIPAEGDMKDSSTWLSNASVKSILSSERLQAKNVMVIADSCYSGAMLRGGPSLLPLTDTHYMEKLTAAAAKRSRQIISSGGLEPVADGGADGHSLFAYYLIKALRENDSAVIDLENLFHTRVWKPVTEIGGQRPNVGRLKTPMDDDGQFVLYNAAWVSEQQKRVEESRRQSAEAEKRKAEEADRMAAVQAERQRLELERQKLEMEKQLATQRQILELQKLKLEKEKQELEFQKMAQQLEAMKRSADAAPETPALASLSPKVAAAPRLDGAAATVAVLPMKVQVNGSVLSALTLANALTDAIGDRRNARVSHSFYPDIHSPDIAMLSLSSKETDGVWTQSGFFANPEPDVKSIVTLGKKLGVDYAYCAFATKAAGPIVIVSYIVDIKSKKVQSDTVKGNYLTVKQALAAELGKTMDKMGLGQPR